MYTNERVDVMHVHTNTAVSGHYTSGVLNRMLWCGHAVSLHKSVCIVKVTTHKSIHTNKNIWLYVNKVLSFETT